MLICFKSSVLGVKKTGLDIWLRSYTFNLDGTGVHLDEMIKSLQDCFGYTDFVLRDQMTFDTTIKITKKAKKLLSKKYNYTIQIRNWGKGANEDCFRKRVKRNIWMLFKDT